MAIPDAWGIPYYDVVSLCWLAYKGNGAKTGERWQSQTGAVWSINNVYERGAFRAVLAQGSKLILSFSGTDEGADWGDNITQGLAGISGQYARALRTAARSTCEMVVGHSLGGGLASYVAVYQGRIAATVNPAPLNTNIASIIGSIRNGGRVVNYVAPGEALDILDIAAPNMHRVGRIIPVASNGGANPINRHLLNHLVGFTPPVKI